MFNMGIGMVCLIDADEVDAVTAALIAAGESVARIGEVTAGTGEVHLSA